jgi:hypothetical protein
VINYKVRVCDLIWSIRCKEMPTGKTWERFLVIENKYEKLVLLFLLEAVNIMNQPETKAAPRKGE